MSTDESIDDTASIWTLFFHTGIYVMAIGSFIPAGLGIFCCYFFWCQPARLVCWPLWSGSMQHTIVDDGVGAAPIYRCNGKAGQPMRSMTCVWNRNLHRWRVDRSNKHSQKHFLHPDHWIQNPKSREHDKHIWFVVRLRIGTVAASLNRLIDLLWRTRATSHSTTTHVHNLIVNYRTIAPFTFEEAWAEATHPQIKGHASLPFWPTVWIHQAPFGPLHINTFRYQYKPRNLWT